MLVEKAAVLTANPKNQPTNEYPKTAVWLLGLGLYG